MTRYMSEDLEGVRSHSNGAVSLETRMSSVVVTHVRPHHTLYARCRAASCLDLIAPAPCKHIEPCSFPLCTHGEIRPRRASPLAPVNSHLPPNPTSFGQQSSRYQHHGARSVEPANELLELIHDCMTSDHDMLNFRSTCKTVESVTRRMFARSYFTTRDIWFPRKTTTSDSAWPVLPRDLAAATTELHVYCKHGAPRTSSVLQPEGPLNGIAARTRTSAMHAAALAVYLTQFPNIDLVRFGEDGDADDEDRGEPFPYNDGYTPNRWDITEDFTTVMAALRVCNIKLWTVAIEPWNCPNAMPVVADLEILLLMEQQLAEIKTLSLLFTNGPWGSRQIEDTR